MKRLKRGNLLLFPVGERGVKLRGESGVKLRGESGVKRRGESGIKAMSVKEQNDREKMKTR